MIATQNQQASTKSVSLTTSTENKPSAPIQKPLSLFLPARLIMHTPQAGLNRLVDAASYLFSLVSKLKKLRAYRHVDQLQQELIKEITHFQETIEHQGYNPEYVLVCRYIMCALFDDIISHTRWGKKQWQSYSLLLAFQQDPHHEKKFFSILSRAIDDPNCYIDLMELIYICFSLGYKGPYRGTENSQHQLEQIVNHLYKHLQTKRGGFSKRLSPVPIKTKLGATTPTFSFASLFFLTASIIMTLFICLGYLMDIISNETYQKFRQIEIPIAKSLT